MTDLNELRKLAEAATRGPWTGDSEYDRDHHGQHPRIYGDGALIACVGNAEDWIDAADQWQANAAFILAANPAAVLELIGEVDRLNSACELLLNDIAYMRKLTGKDAKEFMQSLIDECSQARARAKAAEANAAWLDEAWKIAFQGISTTCTSLKTERDALRDSLEEILDYRGGADNALEDEYVMDRARTALARAEQQISASQE